MGVGEQVVAGARASEVLPAGWNADSSCYSLVYQHDKQGGFLLKVIRMDDSLVIHLMRISDEKATSMNIQTESYANQDLSCYESAVKNVEGLEKQVKSELLDEFASATESSARSSSSSHEPSQTDPLRAGPTQGPARGPSSGPDYDPLRIGPVRGPGAQQTWPGHRDPFAVGRADLDPLAGGFGGGMIMDPFHQGGVPGFGPRGPRGGLPGSMPPGAVPPGARFDPFGPPDPDNPFGRGGGGGRAGPGPDHLRPPGFDDMFM